MFGVYCGNIQNPVERLNTRMEVKVGGQFVSISLLITKYAFRD